MNGFNGLGNWYGGNYFPAGNVAVYGRREYGPETVDSINVLGMVTLMGTVVRQETIIKGMLTMNGAHLNKVNVQGNVEGTNCEIDGRVDIEGRLNDTGSTFSDLISIASKDISFNGSRTKDIVVRHSDGGGHQKVTLSGNARIEGDITFEDGDGRVVISAGSDCTGRIRGGQIVRE